MKNYEKLFGEPEAEIIWNWEKEKTQEEKDKDFLEHLKTLPKEKLLQIAIYFIELENKRKQNLVDSIISQGSSNPIDGKPKGKSVDIEKTEEGPQFKVGDKVKVKKEYIKKAIINQDYGDRYKNWCVNNAEKIFTIKRIDRNKIRFSCSHYSFIPNEIEKVEPKYYVKSWEEIKKTLDCNYWHKAVLFMFFSSKMKNFCNKELKDIKRIIGNKIYAENFEWHKDWIEERYE